jgi:hypothetical protein
MAIFGAHERDVLMRLRDIAGLVIGVDQAGAEIAAIGIERDQPVEIVARGAGHGPQRAGAILPQAAGQPGLVLVPAQVHLAAVAP